MICSCHYHEKQQRRQENKSQTRIQKDHVINLLQKKFISPFKILYMIDQKEADYFKQRNKNEGCCSSNSITIPSEHLTRLEKLVVEVTNYFFLDSHLDKIFKYCHQRFSNIIESGKKDNMNATNQIEKFLLEKVTFESINNYLYQVISRKLIEKADNLKDQIGLWATPATWKKRYPQFQLNNLSGELINNLLNDKCGFAIDMNLMDDSQRLRQEFSFLEKDGKFEEVLRKQQNPLQRNDTKIMTNPEFYAEMKELECKEKAKFPNLQQYLILLSSISFQLNQKANLFCLINEACTVSFFKDKVLHKMHQEDCKITVLSLLGGETTLKVQNKSNKQILQKKLKQGSTIFINNDVNIYEIESNKPQMFLINKNIHALKKK